MSKSKELLNKTILVVDDNSDMLQIIRDALEVKGADVYTARNGKEGLASLSKYRPDLVVLDIAMPIMDGWETLGHIRKISAVPIIMVTAMASEDDEVLGLKLGAVDYITKPFSKRILRARVVAALRKAEEKSESIEVKELVYKDAFLSIDLKTRLVTVGGTAVHLSKTEFALLEYLFLHNTRAISSKEIISHVWGENYHDAINNLYVYISQLRQKVEKNPKEPQYVLTVYGTGYRFKKQVEPE